MMQNYISFTNPVVQLNLHYSIPFHSIIVQIYKKLGVSGKLGDTSGTSGLCFLYVLYAAICFLVPFLLFYDIEMDV